MFTMLGVNDIEITHTYMYTDMHTHHQQTHTEVYNIKSPVFSWKGLGMMFGEKNG